MATKKKNLTKNMNNRLARVKTKRNKRAVLKNIPEKAKWITAKARRRINDNKLKKRQNEWKKLSKTSKGRAQQAKQIRAAAKESVKKYPGLSVNKLIVNSGYKSTPYISFGAYQKVLNNKSKRVDPLEFHPNHNKVITYENMNTGEKHYGQKPTSFYPNNMNNLLLYPSAFNMGGGKRKRGKRRKKKTRKKWRRTRIKRGGSNKKLTAKEYWKSGRFLGKTWWMPRKLKTGMWFHDTLKYGIPI